MATPAAKSGFLLYGANGYTGSLIAREAVLRGMRPVLAGRNRTAIEELGREFDLETRVLTLDSPSEIDETLRPMVCVLHCAGPFSQTAEPLAAGCLRTGTHYLDITGEALVFEALALRDDEARNAGVMLLPGVGFDVVPSDCLAAHLHSRLPSATWLALGMQGFSAVSRGTARTILESLPMRGLARVGGELKRVPSAWKTRSLDFGGGPAKAITIPWGDVATAYYSTGIPNIEVYLAAPLSTRLLARASNYLGWLFRSTNLLDTFRKAIQAGAPGPTPEQRAKSKTVLWGEVKDEADNRVEAWLEVPEAYTLTVQTALAIVDRVLQGRIVPGFQTPSRLFGADFILQFDGVSRR